MQTKVMLIIEKITPIWFEWLGWLLIIGAIGYISEKTKVPSVAIIYSASYVLFFVYTTNAISKIMNYKLFKSDAANKLLTLIAAIIVMSVSTIVLRQALEALIKNG
jgi:hypothetical protein